VDGESTVGVACVTFAAATTGFECSVMDAAAGETAEASLPAASVGDVNFETAGNRIWGYCDNNHPRKNYYT